MEASGQTPAGADQEGVAAHDPEQGEAAELTEEQKAQREANATQGEQGEQVEQSAPAAGSLGAPSPDQPVATSAPDPAAQSGVPLAEDRAAGVEPGPVEPGNEGAGERPEGADQTSPSAAQPNE